MVEMIKEKANVRRDCTMSIPPNVIEALGVTCGKNTVEFVICQEEDMSDLNALSKVFGDLEKNSKGTAFVLLRGMCE